MRRRYAEWEFETNGITTVVSEWGSGDRHAVVVHGVSGNRMYWSELGPGLATEGWHVWAPDLRGEGESSLPDDAATGRAIETYIADLLAWFDQAGIESCVLAGHSFGGRLAVAFAAAYPERVSKLILIAPAGPDALTTIRTTHPELLLSSSASFNDLADINGQVIDALSQLHARDPKRTTPRAVIQRWLTNLNIDAQGYAKHRDIRPTTTAQMDIIRDEDQSALLSTINCPTVVLRSVDESPILRHTIPHYAEQIPNALFMDDISGGHEIPSASPEAVLKAFDIEHT